MTHPYGVFGEDGLTFVVTNPATPRAFDNFLWNDAVFSCVHQTGVGTCDAQVDGKEAIQRFRENKEKVALVMLDGIMPKKSGKEACLEIKALNPAVKVIFMSGYSENMIDLEETTFKDVHFLQKPVLPSDILKKVREVLDQKENGLL